MIYFPETIIQWVRYYWEYLHTFSSRLCTLTHTVQARVLKPWRGRLPSIFSSYHVFSPLLSGLNWRSLTPPGGPGPFISKMATLSTGSAHTPSPGFRTVQHGPSTPTTIHTLFYSRRRKNWDLGTKNLFQIFFSSQKTFYSILLYTYRY